MSLDATGGPSGQGGGGGRTFRLWALAFLVTVVVAAYQRFTGPTFPVRASAEIAGERVRARLPRTWSTGESARISVRAPGAEVAGTLEWRRYKSHDEWRLDPMEREGDSLVGLLPSQPPAGKVMYRVVLRDAAGAATPLTRERVVLRFKGSVPAAVLAPHIALMFLAILLGTRAGFEALAGRPKAYGLACATSICLAFGGLLLGPIVQKLAFGAYWTGWPIGTDLTDNKVAVSMLAWIAALLGGRKAGKGGRAWIVAAAAIQILVYVIPHSMLGSEIDFTALEPPAGS